MLPLSTAQARTLRPALTLSLVLCIAQPIWAQWVAFNDHAPGNGTHLNTTRYDVFGNGRATNGFLRNVVTGTNLPAYLRIVRANSVGSADAAGFPAEGTLLHAVFDDFVDFAGSPDNSVELTGSGVVTYSFSGLRPDLRYSFKGSAVRGDPAYVNRWTLCEIAGARAYVSAHSSTRVLTTTQVPSLTPTQAALNTGVNHTPATGDYVGWDDIVPAPDGTFSITCRQYTGTVPGGSSGGSKGYGLTGIRLEESPCPNPTPLGFVLQPQTQAAIEGWPVSFNAGVTGCPVSYRWFKDGLEIPGATASSYFLKNASSNDAGNFFVMASNMIGSVTSTVAKLTVYPDLSVPLIPLTYPWRYNQSGGDLGTGWKEAGYPDASWPTGNGVFGVESDPAIQPLINTPLSLSGTNGQPVITYYFRTHFTLTNNPQSVYLSFSNLVDDGAVVWLNGAELYRLNMSNGPVNARSLANNATEGAFQVINVPGDRFVLGDNLLAVEVHQESENSGDVVFACTLNCDPADSGAVLMRSQPQSLTITVGESPNFTVRASGQEPLSYQWRGNGIDLPGQTNAILTLTNAGIAEDGFYAVRVTNPFGSLLSRPARLNVNTSNWIPFYAADFTHGAGSEWSPNLTENTPVGARRFLGQFSSDSVNLTLNNLPVHQEVTVSFDLYLIKSWDGNSTGFIGPDEWKLEVNGGPELLHSTFSNWQNIERAEQCFPNGYPGDSNPSLSGAAETNTLGYTHAGNLMDSVYHLTRTFQHAGSQLWLQFSSTNLQGVIDESWGLDNVKVYLGRSESLRFLSGQITNGVLSVQLQGMNGGHAVIVESSTTMNPGSWVPVLTNAGPGPLEILPRTDTPRRFYRAMER